MDAVYHAFMGTYKMILWLANRSGGKTMNFAISSCLDSEANDNCESANLGAIQAQAQRCYRYMQNIINSAATFRGFVKGIPTITRTNFINKSSIEVLVATITGVNSPHPQKLKMDEIELIPWAILQEAFSMVQGRNEVKGVTVLGSTRKFANGPMQKLVESSSSKGMKIFSWCIWEVMEKFPEDPEFAQTIRDTLGSDIPENTKAFSGYYKWEDLLEKYQALDRDVWETQWLSKKPDLTALIYSRFDEAKNVTVDFKLDRENKSKQIYIFEDFGNSKDHPDVCLFVEHDSETQKIVVFDELYMSDMASSKMVEEVVKKLRGYGLEVADLSGWIPDHHMLTQVIDRKNMGLPILGPVDATMVENPGRLYLIENGVHLVRKFIDEKRFMITANCEQLRQEFLSYSRRRKPNGEYADDPEKKNDHGPDAVRYGLVFLYPAIALGTFGEDVARFKPAEILHPAYDEDPEVVDSYEYEDDETYTGSLLGKTF